MDDLTPVTRTERLLDGEDLTPTNREEMFIKRIYDKTQEIPEPVNRKEYFLKKAGEAGGDVTVVPLSVTSNGTYSEEGKAYSPVTVEVSPPEDSYQLKSITTPTSLATFEASNMPMPSLKVSVEAKQEGSGVPSPENVRPIIGWDAANVSDVGKNLLNPLKVKAEFQYNPPVGTQFTLTDIDDMTDNGDGTFSKTISGWYEFGYLFELTESECFFKIQYSGTGARVTYGFLDDNYTVLSSESNSETNQTITKLLAKTGTRKYFFFTATTNQTTADITFTEPQIEVGTLATDYEPYINQTTTISLPQTVYGGEVDVVNGVLKITDGYIASYNGETLPSTWISSMDEYAEGTSPTTGAEVCYELANPIITNLTPTLIKSLNGQNNLSVDCGEVIEGEYFIELGGE